jgi:hypothetical protein
MVVKRSLSALGSNVLWSVGSGALKTLAIIFSSVMAGSSEIKSINAQDLMSMALSILNSTCWGCSNSSSLTRFPSAFISTTGSSSPSSSLSSSTSLSSSFFSWADERLCSSILRDLTAGQYIVLEDGAYIQSDETVSSNL